MCIFGGGGGASKDLARQQQQQADEARADQARKAASLKQGMGNIDNAFAGFNDDYFANLSKSYRDYAKPQLDDQYEEAKKNITYSLARKGNLNSTVAGDQMALLDRQYANNETSLEGTGMDYANAARRDVQSNKDSVISQLNTSFDSDAANTEALARAKALAAPVSFSPLGQLFTNVSAIAAQNKIASDSNPANYGARLFGNRTPGSYGVGGFG